MREGARHAHRRGFKAVWHQRGTPCATTSASACFRTFERNERGTPRLRASRTSRAHASSSACAALNRPPSRRSSSTWSSSRAATPPSRARKAILEKEREKVREAHGRDAGGASTALTTRLPTTRTSSSRPSRRWPGGPNRGRAFYLQFFSACTNLSRPDTPSRKRGRLCAAWAPPAGANGAVCRFPRRLTAPSELPCKPAVRLRKEKCKRLR